MAENTGNQFWQLLTCVLIPVAAIIITVILWLRSRQRKDLSFLTSCTTVLPNVEDTVRKKLKILYEKKEVKQIYLNTVTLLCSGNEPIRTKDYEKPITLDFGNTLELLSAEIVKPSKRCLDTSFEIGKGSVSLTPILMNHGDRIDMKILTESRPEKMAIRARIAGIDEIKEIRRHQKISFLIFNAGFIFLGVALYDGLEFGLSVISAGAQSIDFYGWPFVKLLIWVSVGLSLIATGRFMARPKL